jgi:hypothetical protein
VGIQALLANTTGAANTAMGLSALVNNTTGNNQTAVGHQALFSNTTGGQNTAVGQNALVLNTTGNNNTATGFQALLANTTGSNNAAAGGDALTANTTGNNNTAIGVGAGSALTTGSNNTIIGRVAGTAGLDSTVIIAAGVTERMRIDSSGNLGLGTTAPTVQFQINGTQPQIQWSNPTTGATSDDGTHLYLSGSDFWLVNKEAASMVFATNNSERARINSTGDLLVGTTSYAGGSATGQTMVSSGTIYQNGGTAGINFVEDKPSGYSETAYHIFRVNFTTVGSITTTGSATAYNTSSDYRLKDIDGPIANSGAYIDALKPVQGSWKADGSRFIGLLAHEAQEVSETTIATGEKDGEQMQAMDYSAPEIIANLIAELQSLRARVAQLEGN